MAVCSALRTRFSSYFPLSFETPLRIIHSPSGSVQLNPMNRCAAENERSEDDGNGAQCLARAVLAFFLQVLTLFDISPATSQNAVATRKHCGRVDRHVYRRAVVQHQRDNGR